MADETGHDAESQYGVVSSKTWRIRFVKWRKRTDAGEIPDLQADAAEARSRPVRAAAIAGAENRRRQRQNEDQLAKVTVPYGKA
jgi:hypothetical protein